LSPEARGGREGGRRAATPPPGRGGRGGPRRGGGRRGMGAEGGGRDLTERFAELRAEARRAGGVEAAAEVGVSMSPLEAAGKALSRARDRCQSAVRQLSDARAQLEGERDRSRCLAEQRAHVRSRPVHTPTFPTMQQLPCPPARPPARPPA